MILDEPSSPNPLAEENQSPGEASTSPLSESVDKVVEDESENVTGQVAKISISHDGEYATAVCMVAEGPLLGDVGGEAAARSP